LEDLQKRRGEPTEAEQSDTCPFVVQWRSQGLLLIIQWEIR